MCQILINVILTAVWFWLLTTGGGDFGEKTMLQSKPEVNLSLKTSLTGIKLVWRDKFPR